LLVLNAKGKLAALLTLATALGLGAWIASVRPEFKEWLKSDWTHCAFAGAIVLFLAAYAALFQIQFRLAGAESLQLISSIRTAEFRPELINNQALPPSVVARDVLIARLNAVIQKRNAT
jgi:hypothetical protein